MIEEELMAFTKSAEIREAGTDGARQYYTCISLRGVANTTEDIRKHCVKGIYRHVPNAEKYVITKDTYTCRYMPDALQTLYLERKYPKNFFYQ